MTFHGIHHIVFEVDGLLDAETFYRDLFDLDVLFREGDKDGEYGALPDDIEWDDAIAAGVEPGMSFLGRDGVALALMEGDGDSEAGRLDHVALAVDSADRDAIRDRAAELNCEFEQQSHSVFVTDRYGIEWEVNPSSPPPETPFDTLDI